MPVYWSVRAQRHLEEALSEKSCCEWVDHQATTSGGVLDQTRAHLDGMLMDAFREAVVFVKDQVIGYRRKKELFILLVEVFGARGTIRSGPYVVKIGPANKLEREVHGWNCCRPPGLHHDLVFLGLDDEEPRVFDGKQWKCLVYGDAQQVLGVNVTMTFEDAALQCIRHGLPTSTSVVAVINNLYERVGHLFYSRAFVDDPKRMVRDRKPIRHVALDSAHFDDNLKLWDDDRSCVAARNDVGAALASRAGYYLDPVDYLRFVQHHVDHTVTGPDGKPTIIAAAYRQGEPALPGLTPPDPLDLIPRTLRGCAHGDLHGRNILVGIIHDDAMWPTIFDYEDMGPCNAIGWDFVKFETELKIRAYHHVFAEASASKYVLAIRDFEADLGHATEECHRGSKWSHTNFPGKERIQESRLKAILLAVRRMASQHLGTNHGRPKDWLEEYYFLLAAYGVVTSRFENLVHRERVGALVSAGVAASRLDWPRAAEKSRVPDRPLSHPAAEDRVMASDETSTEEVATDPIMSAEEILAVPVPGYHWPLDLARQYARSGIHHQQAAAVELLRGLAGNYPHALAIGQELVFVLMELKQHPAAELELAKLDETFRNLDMESLCRWGRIFKDLGDRHADLDWVVDKLSPSPMLAEQYYQKAVAKYGQAFEVDEDHYPVINKATLLLILAALKATASSSTRGGPPEEVIGLAGKILRDSRWESPSLEDRNVWFPATRGEAHLLRQEWADARSSYEEAKNSDQTTPHAREAMRRQVWRIRDAFIKLNVTPAPPFDDPDAFFGVKPTAKTS